MTRGVLVLIAFAWCCMPAAGAKTRAGLPAGFVYLSDVAPTIVQDVRYAGSHNFLGRTVAGYLAPACILTQRAAQALAKAQNELEAAGLTLRVYDCYRPQRAVDDFIAWSKNASDQKMKAEYYPRIDKSRVFELGYLAPRSSHTRGSGVDLTIQRLPIHPRTPWEPGKHSCIAPFLQRYHDGSIDMGTNYDCLDPLSLAAADAGALAGTHRLLLRDVMEKYGFAATGTTWWEFTLRSEPFPKTYFDFPVAAK